jgi:hypothetical protein
MSNSPTTDSDTARCTTCGGDGRILVFYARGPASPPGNHWVGCPDCEAGRAYDVALRAEVATHGE